MLEEAIRSRDFQGVVEAINRGEKLPSTLEKYTRKLIFDILVNEKKFDILTLFAVHKIIETDIYEYENFDYSIFDSLLNFKLPDEQNEAFFETFLEHFTNINDEINKLPKAVSRTAVVSSEGLTHRGDTLHFDSPSAEELGKRYAAKMILLQKK